MVGNKRGSSIYPHIPRRYMVSLYSTRAPPGQTSHLRLSRLTYDCQVCSLATVTHLRLLLAIVLCPLGWGGWGGAITFTGTSDGMVASTGFIPLGWHWSYSLHFPILFTSLLFPFLYFLYFLLSSLPYSLQIPTVFKCLLFSVSTLFTSLLFTSLLSSLPRSALLYCLHFPWLSNSVTCTVLFGGLGWVGVGVEWGGVGQERSLGLHTGW